MWDSQCFFFFFGGGVNKYGVLMVFQDLRRFYEMVLLRFVGFGGSVERLLGGEFDFFFFEMLGLFEISISFSIIWRILYDRCLKEKIHVLSHKTIIPCICFYASERQS